MHIINARLRNLEGLHELHLENGLISNIARQTEAPTLGPDDLDAGGNLVVPPFVEPHIHLDATLTAGEPRWNMSGTLFEGIECWGERKATITLEDTKTRTRKTIQALAAHGIQHVRTHVDVTDPTLTALKAMLEVREESRHLPTGRHRVVPQRSGTDGRSHSHGRGCGRRHSAFREHPRPGCQFGKVPDGPGRTHRLPGGRALR
jgi:cytosine/adenosine deaminase-related metal-dependent hydrolase